MSEDKEIEALRQYCNELVEQLRSANNVIMLASSFNDESSDSRYRLLLRGTADEYMRKFEPDPSFEMELQE